MRSRNSTFAMSLLISLAALASPQTQAAVAGDTSTAATTKLSAADKQFFKKAAIGGMTEVSAGKLAAENGTTDSVKKFGQRMVDDHTKAGEQLKALAAQKSIELPSAPDEKHQAMLDKLKTMNGADFDKVFIADMKAGHADAIATFKAGSQSKDADIAKFATATLPTLHDHAHHIPAVSAKTGM